MSEEKDNVAEDQLKEIIWGDKAHENVAEDFDEVEKVDNYKHLYFWDPQNMDSNITLDKKRLLIKYGAILKKNIKEKYGKDVSDNVDLKNLSSYCLHRLMKEFNLKRVLPTENFRPFNENKITNVPYFQDFNNWDYTLSTAKRHLLLKYEDDLIKYIKEKYGEEVAEKTNLKNINTESLNKLIDEAGIRKKEVKIMLEENIDKDVNPEKQMKIDQYGKLLEAYVLRTYDEKINVNDLKLSKINSLLVEMRNSIQDVSAPYPIWKEEDFEKAKIRHQMLESDELSNFMNEKLRLEKDEPTNNSEEIVEVSKTDNMEAELDNLLNDSTPKPANSIVKTFETNEIIHPQNEIEIEMPKNSRIIIKNISCKNLYIITK